MLLIRTGLTGVKSLPVRVLLKENEWGVGLILYPGRFNFQYIAKQIYKISERYCVPSKIYESSKELFSVQNPGTIYQDILKDH